MPFGFAVLVAWAAAEVVVVTTLMSGIAALSDCNDKDEVLRLNGGRDMTRWTERRLLRTWMRPYGGAICISINL